jgi:hypothetical protein
VILYRFDRHPLEGYVHPNTYLQPTEIEILTANGNLQSTAYTEIKAVCFASEQGRTDLFTEQNFFERRPKAAGLWARFTFRDNDQLDGILSHNLLEWPEAGYFITPPKAGSTRQRVFIPRAALVRTELLGVVGASVATRARARRPGDEDSPQLKMFD